MFYSLKKVFSVLLFLLISNFLLGADYYWVGGTGNWSDISHWATTSGGTINYLQVPTPFDDVFFDANSFTGANQTIVIDVPNAVCKDFNWSGALFTPTITGSNDFRIYGSLFLISDMNWNMTGQTLFEATSVGKTITSAGHNFSNHVTFQGIGGGWTFLDDISSTYDIRILNGSLNTNGKNVSCRQFSTSGNNLTLTITNSIITCNWPTYNGWQFGGDNISFNMENSLIILQNCYFSSSATSYNNVIFNGTSWANLYTSGSTFNKIIANLSLDFYGNSNIIDSLISSNGIQVKGGNNTIGYIAVHGLGRLEQGGNTIGKALFFNNGDLYGNNSFDTLIFSPGNFYYFEAGKTQQINKYLLMRGNGCFPITLQSNISGLQSNISKNSGTISADYVEMRDQNATGGAQFYAGEYSTNVSNNTGWQFSNAPNYSYGLGPDTSFCQGDTLLLITTNFNGGIAWLWQNGTTLPYFNVIQPGTYWVKVSYSDNCFYSDTIHITQKPKPEAIALNNSPICTGDTLKLFGSGGNNYSWIGPAGFSSSDQNPQIFNSNNGNAGNYILSTYQNGCNSDPDTTTVIIDNIISPIISITASLNPAPSGVLVTFNAAFAGGGSTPVFQWMVNGINVGTNSPTYTYIPANDDQIMCLLTSNLTCVVNNPATSNIITIQVTTSNPCPGIPTVSYGGQTYNTVEIGTQCWFKENVNIGTRINGSSDQTNNGIIEKYCYDDLESNCDIYGGLYQWDEVMAYSSTEGAQGICPPGWHIPTDCEWCTLTYYLDTNVVCFAKFWNGTNAGGKMKEEGFEHWLNPNTGATNESDFTALPGGSYSIFSNDFIELNERAEFWSSTDNGTPYAEFRELIYFSAIAYRIGINKNSGL